MHQTYNRPLKERERTRWPHWRATCKEVAFLSTALVLHFWRCTHCIGLHNSAYGSWSKLHRQRSVLHNAALIHNNGPPDYLHSGKPYFKAKVQAMEEQNNAIEPGLYSLHSRIHANLGWHADQSYSKIHSIYDWNELLLDLALHLQRSAWDFNRT